MRKQTGLAIMMKPHIHDMYVFQELAADGTEIGAPQRLGYIDARTKIQLAAPNLSRVYIDHCFALAHSANGGPIDVVSIDERKGALNWSARLSRVVP